jgi:peptide deformylase
MRVVAKGWNMHGEPITVEGSELLARAIQHETDHLDGIVFIDRLDEQTRKIAMKDIRESQWFSESLVNGKTPTVKISPHNTFGKGF